MCILAGSFPDVCREGAWQLSRWHDAQMQKMARTQSEVTDLLWTVIREGVPCHARRAGEPARLPAYRKRLDVTGREEGAAALREKYADYLETP